jgi:hypothetical protein
MRQECKLLNRSGDALDAVTDTEVNTYSTSRFRTENEVAVHYWRKCLAFSLFSVLLSISLFFVFTYLRMFSQLHRWQLPILRVNSVDATKRSGSGLFMLFALHIQRYLRETTEYVCRNTEPRFKPRPSKYVTRSKNWKIFSEENGVIRMGTPQSSHPNHRLQDV